MNIVMFTNTYKPHVGGVANSVDRFANALREQEHAVLVVAPEFPDQPADDPGVHRIPAIQNFNGSDFSVALPVKPDLNDRLDRFAPDIVHAHHPYLLGDTALRAAARYETPVAFTHHTFYEHYTHYTPLDSPRLRAFVIELSTRYANLCDRVIAPSGSVADIIAERGVETPVTVIPTGIDPDRFEGVDGSAFRRRNGIPADAPLIGHLGRLAKEKNLDFLGRAVSRCLKDRDDAWFAAVGSGDFADGLETMFEDAGVAERTVFPGTLEGKDVADAYAAMDVFAFASLSETQGMVLVEAMACGVPVVALDAPGARDVVADGETGRLLADEDEAEFAGALREQIDSTTPDDRRRIRETAERWSMERCAERLEKLYRELLETRESSSSSRPSGWDRFLEQMDREWDLWTNRAAAVGEALGASEEDPSS